MKRWIAVGVWVTVTYGTIPFVRRLRAAFVSHWPAELIGCAVMVAVAAASLASLWLVRRSGRTVSPVDLAWVTGSVAFIIGWSWRLMDQPEEAVHFLEYGVLAVLLYRALRPHIDDPGVFVAGALIGTIIGTGDEIIQWITPGRYWDFRDLVLNGGASALAQIVIWRYARRTSPPVAARTARLLIRLAAVEVLLLVLCLAATPQRLGELARDLPVLGPLAAGDDVIAEYGFLHRVDARTLFRSRLSQDELVQQDRVRAAEVAALLDSFGGRYGAFRQSVPAIRDPFAYEARVHIFARNRSFAEARRHAPGSRPRRESMTEAAREDLILTHSFGATLDRSTFRWPDRRRHAVEAEQDTDELFSSDVARHLITWPSEPTLRTALLGVVVALIVADRILGRSVNRPRTPPARE